MLGWKRAIARTGKHSNRIPQNIVDGDRAFPARVEVCNSDRRLCVSADSPRAIANLGLECAVAIAEEYGNGVGDVVVDIVCHNVKVPVAVQIGRSNSGGIAKLSLIGVRLKRPVSISQEYAKVESVVVCGCEVWFVVAVEIRNYHSFWSGASSSGVAN